jgi:hypothetical protein
MWMRAEERATFASAAGPGYVKGYAALPCKLTATLRATDRWKCGRLPVLIDDL